jgi:hypothetical protein
MGYFQQLEAELQGIDDPRMREIVLWKRAHEHLMTAEELWAVMKDEVRMERALTLWENEMSMPLPKKASDHVALQTPMDLQPKSNRVCVIGWALIVSALVVGVTVIVVSL